MDLKLDGRIGQITQEDIDTGLKQDCSNCPFALSLERFFEDFFEPYELRSRKDFHVEVDLCSTEIRIKGLNFDHILIFNDNKVENWIENFDAGFTVEPVEYEFSEREFDRTALVGEPDIEDEILNELWITLRNYEVENHAA